MFLFDLNSLAMEWYNNGYLLYLPKCLARESRFIFWILKLVKVIFFTQAFLRRGIQTLLSALLLVIIILCVYLRTIILYHFSHQFLSIKTNEINTSGQWRTLGKLERLKSSDIEFNFKVLNSRNLSRSTKNFRC